MKELISVLKSLGITAAVSLDDDYTSMLGTGSHQFVDIDSFLSAYGEKLTAVERACIDTLGAITLGDLFQDENAPDELKNKINRLMAADERQSLRVLSYLEAAFKDTPIAYNKISNIHQIGEFTGRGTIWFLDKEIQGQDGLPAIIPEITNASNQTDIPCLIVVFTSEDAFKNINDSWDKRYRYLYEQCRLDKDLAQSLAYSFFVISKKELLEKLETCKEDAQQYMADIITDCLGGFCVYNLLIKMEAYDGYAYENLKDWAKDARTAALENLYYNMVTEGASNAYRSIKTIHGLMHENTYTTHFGEVSKYILALKNLASSPADLELKISAETINDILCHHEWAQYQFLHKDVNTALSDINHGDVFECRCSYNGKELRSYIGVLSTQPCDCVIRAGKDQSKRKADMLTLLLFEKQALTHDMIDLEKSPKNDHKKTVQKVRDYGIFIGKETDDEGKWTAFYIDASSCCAAIHVKPFILDLTSLDNEGKAKLKSEAEIKEIVEQQKTQNWKGYLPELQSEIADFKARQDALQGKMADETEGLLSSIYGIPFSLEKQEFDICRIGHIESNLTELVSYHYVSHAYRTGKNCLIALHDPQNEQGDA